MQFVCARFYGETKFQFVEVIQIHVAAIFVQTKIYLNHLKQRRVEVSLFEVLKCAHFHKDLYL